MKNEKKRMYSYNIVDYGAVGDDQTKNTKAIQATIDQCFDAGGGQVIVPPGVFISGSIFLKDNVDLHLLPGAELKGSPNIEDYNADDCFEQNQAFKQENVTGAHLIMAVEATNVSITGRGRINGNSPAFLAYKDDHSKFRIIDKRPAQMVFFVECENVCVSDVELNDATYWTLFIHGCDTVSVRGVRIRNDPRTPNGDGIDVDCSRNVTISDCLIFSGDDSITLRANPKALKDKSRVCENVVISNCVLSTNCNAIRVGVGEGTIRNCSFSNIIIRNSRTGICIVSCYSGTNKRGVTIQNIRFSNMTMEVAAPFNIVSGFDSISPIENIFFDNIFTTAFKTSFIYGNNKAIVRNINFTNVEVAVSAGGNQQMEEREIQLPKDQEWFQGLSTGFLIANADQVRFVNFRIRGAEQAKPGRDPWRAPWQHCVTVRNSTNLDIEKSLLENPFTTPGNSCL